MTRDDDELWKLLLNTANQKFSGHLTIFKFTTNWRIAFGTPFEFDDLMYIPSGMTFAEAATKTLTTISAAPLRKQKSVFAQS